MTVEKLPECRDEEIGKVVIKLLEILKEEETIVGVSALVYLVVTSAIYSDVEKEVFMKDIHKTWDHYERRRYNKGGNDTAS